MGRNNQTFLHPLTQNFLRNFGLEVKCAFDAFDKSARLDVDQTPYQLNIDFK
jgi:hypothetical protein